MHRECFKTIVFRWSWLLKRGKTSESAYEKNGQTKKHCIAKLLLSSFAYDGQRVKRAGFSPSCSEG
eukprot:6241041-Amphidinium_carterae.1